MSDENKGRAVLGMVARDAVQAVASSSLIWPAAGPAPNGEAAEGAREVTAEQVVNALEGVYGVNRGRRRNHTKGFGALGSFVGAPEAAAYSRSALFSGHEIEVVARFSVAGGDPTAVQHSLQLLPPLLGDEVAGFGHLKSVALEERDIRGDDEGVLGVLHHGAG